MGLTKLMSIFVFRIISFVLFDAEICVFCAQAGVLLVLSMDRWEWFSLYQRCSYHILSPRFYFLAGSMVLDLSYWTFLKDSSLFAKSPWFDYSTIIPCVYWFLIRLYLLPLWFTFLPMNRTEMWTFVLRLSLYTCLGSSLDILTAYWHLRGFISLLW